MVTVKSSDLKSKLDELEYDNAIHKMADKIRETANLFNVSNCDVMRHVRDEVKNINNHGIHTYKSVDYPTSENKLTEKEVDKYTTVSFKKPCECQKSKDPLAPQ